VLFLLLLLGVGGFEQLSPLIMIGKRRSAKRETGYFLTCEVIFPGCNLRVYR